MTFIAFNLEDLQAIRGDAGLMVGVIFVRAKSLEAAKDFMASYYPGNAWAVVPKKTFDKGIVHQGGKS
jgi:hypothetical protein